MILDAHGLSKTYSSPNGESLKIFENLDFKIERGETLSLMGPSGSGKTTLMSTLAGLDKPTAGFVKIDGQDIYSLSEKERIMFRSSKIGIIFQQFHLMPFLTALQNIELPLQLRNAPLDAAEEALKKVGLWERRTHLPHQMSRGECQRVAIARVIAMRPALIFADEPTGSLDKKNAEHIMDLILDLINNIPGSSLLLVTHDQQLAKLCRKQYAIDNGRLSSIDMTSR